MRNPIILRIGPTTPTSPRVPLAFSPLDRLSWLRTLSLLNDFHPGLVNAYVPGGQGGSQEAIVEGPMSSDEDHLKMAFSSFARRTEALAICFLRIGSARTR